MTSRKAVMKGIFILESQKPAQQQQQPAPRAAPVARNARRNRVVAGPQAPVAQAADPVDSDDETAGVEFDEKMGAKKRAKLEAKAEKKAQREAELKSREEQKKRDGEWFYSSLHSFPYLVTNYSIG